MLAHILLAVSTSRSALLIVSEGSLMHCSSSALFSPSDLDLSSIGRLVCAPFCPRDARLGLIASRVQTTAQATISARFEFGSSPRASRVALVRVSRSWNSKREHKVDNMSHLTNRRPANELASRRRNLSPRDETRGCNASTCIRCPTHRRWRFVAEGVK